MNQNGNKKEKSSPALRQQMRKKVEAEGGEKKKEVDLAVAL